MSALSKIRDLPPDRAAEWKQLQQGLPQPATDGAALVIEKRPAIASVLSRTADLTPEQFLTAAIAECNSLPPGCREVSVVKAVFNAAALGLMLGSGRGHAYLVPFKDRKATEREGRNVYEVQLVIGYLGFTNLAYRTGFLQSLTTELVLADEECEIWVDETGRRLKHVTPVARKVPGDGSNIKAAYCLYHTRTGGRGIVVVTRDEIEQCKQPYSDTWRYHYPAMAKKTAIRRAAKEWALTDSLAMAVRLDEQAEAGLEQMSIVGDVSPSSRLLVQPGHRPAAYPDSPHTETPSAPAVRAPPIREATPTDVPPTQPTAQEHPAKTPESPAAATQPSEPPAEPPRIEICDTLQAAIERMGEGTLSIHSFMANLLQAKAANAVTEADYLRYRATFLAGREAVQQLLRDIEDSETLALCREATTRLHDMRRQGQVAETLHRLLSRRSSERFKELSAPATRK